MSIRELGQPGWIDDGMKCGAIPVRTGHPGRRSLSFPGCWGHAGGVRSRQWCGRALVIGVAMLLLVGCGSGESGTPGEAGSTRPSETSTETADTTRPTAEELQTATRNRGPVERVAGTIHLAGVALGIAVDPVTGTVFVLTCPGCGRVPGDDAQVIEVIDMATRSTVGEIPIPAHSARIAVDPYAGVLYVSHTGERGEQIRMIDTTSHQVIGTIDVAVWGITVDPTTGLVHAVQEDPADRSTSVVAIDPRDASVVRRVEVGVDAVAGLAVDPVRGLLLVSDHSVGRLLVLDMAAGTVERTIQVVKWLADPCENCLGSIGTPVVDFTTGLAYLAGGPDVTAEDLNPSQARGSTAARVVPAGLAYPDGDRIVPAGFGTSVLYVVDPGAGRVTQSVGVPFVAGSHTIDLSAGVVYLSVMNMPATSVITTSVLPVDIDSLTLEEPVPAPVGSTGTTLLALDPITGQVWVAGGGVVTVLE